MLDFIDAYTLWRTHPFPRSGVGDVLPDIKGDLALADEYVTAVIQFVESGEFRPAVPDALALIHDIRQRLDRVIDHLDPAMREVALEQRAYATLLDVVYRQFLARAPRS